MNWQACFLVCRTNCNIQLKRNSLLLTDVFYNFFKRFIWDGNVQAILAIWIPSGLDQLMIFKFCQMRIQSYLATHQEALSAGSVQIIDWHPWKKKFRINNLIFVAKCSGLEKRWASHLPSSSGWASWCSARILKTLWALGVKLCNTIEAVLTFWELPHWARMRGKNIASTLYGANVGTWCQYQLNCVWTIFLSHTSTS